MQRAWESMNLVCACGHNYVVCLLFLSLIPRCSVIGEANRFSIQHPKVRTAILFHNPGYEHLWAASSSGENTTGSLASGAENLSCPKHWEAITFPTWGQLNQECIIIRREYWTRYRLRWMYAESNVTSSMVHVIHTDSSTIVLPDMAEFTCCTHALIVESKRLASCGTAAMASMSGKIVFLTLALYRMSRHTFNVSL